MPSLAKKPLSYAIQIGQLNPPGKTITLTGCSVWGVTISDTARKLEIILDNTNVMRSTGNKHEPR
jgi:hypothetical protein